MTRHEPAEPGGLDLTAAVSGPRQWLRWRINRLLRALAADAQSVGLVFSAQSVPPADLTARPKFWINGGAKVDASLYTAAADRVAAGRLYAGLLDARLTKVLRRS
ncbi:MAG: hypothetical protein ABI423_13675 [Burkholderiales bacterium]